VLGAALGLFLRRAVPAMALTLVVFAVVQVAVPSMLRPHFVSPISAFVAVIQPDSRYWTFQWYETAIFTGFAALLAGLCFWRIRGRLG